VSLEADLQPGNLVQKVRSIVFSEAITYIGVDSTVDGTTEVQDAILQIETIARELGKAVAADQDALRALLPELVTEKAQQLWHFGVGLVEGTEAHHAIWNQLVTQLAATPRSTQNIQVIRGFLYALNKKEPDLVTNLLDDAVGNEVLGPWYPVLQIAVGIDKQGVSRLIRSLEEGKAGIRLYLNLVLGGATHEISGSDLNNLLMRIAVEPDGLDIAIEILCMRISFARSQSSSSELTDVAN
jgi:hypothetical protein